MHDENLLPWNAFYWNHNKQNPLGKRAKELLERIENQGLDKDASCLVASIVEAQIFLSSWAARSLPLYLYSDERWDE